MTEEEIFQKAIAIADPEARDGFLAGACRGDDPKKARIRKLVQSYFDSDDLLEPITISQLPHSGLTSELKRQIQSNEPSPELQIRYIGNYEIVEEIARGGMGVVFKARQTNLDRIVALKMILPGRLPTEEAERRFQAEAEAAAQLDHPGIVPLYEVGEFEGKHYFSMAFVDGESLAEKISREPMDPIDAAQLLAEIADAVHYAHEQGVVHRDLKPANVLIDSRSKPRVTDFGIAKRLDRPTDITYTGQILGSPSFMAPEQASAEFENVSEKVDIYSLGAILFAVLTGRAPFEADSTFELLKKVVEEEATSPAKLVSGIPRDLETVCLKALQKNPHDRFQTAKEFAQELRRIANGEPIRSRPRGVLSQLMGSKFNYSTIPELFVLMAGVLLTLIAIHQTFWFSEYSNHRNPINYYPFCSILIIGTAIFAAYCYGASQWKCLTWTGIFGCFAFGLLFVIAKYVKVEFRGFEGTIWMYGVPGCLLITVIGFVGGRRIQPKAMRQSWTLESPLHFLAILLLGASIFTPFLVREFDETGTGKISEQIKNTIEQYSVMSQRDDQGIVYWLYFALLAMCCFFLGWRKRSVASVIAMGFVLLLSVFVLNDEPEFGKLFTTEENLVSERWRFAWLYSSILGLTILLGISSSRLLSVADPEQLPVLIRWMFPDADGVKKEAAAKDQ